MKLGALDTSDKILLVAEIGNNHEGNFDAAKKMVQLAAEAGADAVKFQTFKTEQFINPENPQRFDMLKKFELSYGDFEKLAGIARSAGLEFLSTPLDLESASFLAPLVSAFKIASSDMGFYPLLDRISESGKPILLSTGMAELADIQQTQKRIEGVWRRYNHNPGLAALHCVSGYPVPPEEANLAAITNLAVNLNCEIGYSDHCLGIEASILAAALGARVIEKHFTLNKHHSDFRDHQLSADPMDFERLVNRIRQVEKMLGCGDKIIQPCERGLIPLVIRSLAAKRALKKGDKLRMEDVVWTRPGGGVPAGRECELLGRTLTTDIPQGEWITPDKAN